MTRYICAGSLYLLFSCASGAQPMAKKCFLETGLSYSNSPKYKSTEGVNRSLRLEGALYRRVTESTRVGVMFSFLSTSNVTKRLDGDSSKNSFTFTYFEFPIGMVFDKTYLMSNCVTAYVNASLGVRLSSWYGTDWDFERYYVNGEGYQSVVIQNDELFQALVYSELSFGVAFPLAESMYLRTGVQSSYDFNTRKRINTSVTNYSGTFNGDFLEHPLRVGLVVVLGFNI